MKTLMIKAGKAFSTLRREGPIKGGKRVAGAFFAMFGRVGSGDILFITGGVGDSAKYRCWRQAEELSLHGFRCAVTVQDNPFLPRYADKFKIFIFHRVLFTPSVKKMVERIKAQKKEIIFETDDLVHDPEYLKNMDYFKKMNKFEWMLYKDGVGSEILKDDYVKTCVTTTTYLAEKLREYGKRVFISKNKLSNYDVRIMNDIFEKKKKSAGGKIKIGYFSGTASHDKDFETVKDALILILEKYPQVELHLFGPLEIDDVYAKFGERVKKHPFAQWEKYLENIASVDFTVAPLEIGNPFCESKSAIKFTGAGLLGVPTVAAATRTFRETIEDGVDGFVAGDNEEWTEKLEKLVINPDLRKSMGEKAREKVLREYTNKNSHNEEYYEYLKSKILMSNKIQNPNAESFFDRRQVVLVKAIKNIPKFWWILLAIVIVGIFLRTWQHHDWLRFNADQGRDAQIASDAARGKAPLPLLGPKAGGTEFRLGPAFYYFEIAAVKIFGDAPDKMAYPDLLAGILCIPLLFLFLRKFFDKYTSLSLVAIFAVSAYAVRYARFAWNPNSTPFWTILALLAIYEVVCAKKNRKFLWAVVAGAAVGVGVELHTTLLVILPLTTIIVFAWFAFKDKKALKYFFVILAMALLVNTPQLVNELQTKGGNAKDFFRGLKTKNNAESSLADNTIRGVSCWIQGNTDIVSGYEISDTCSFTPGKNTADTTVFLFGSLFVAGGMILAVRYFLKEKDADRKNFLGIVFLFTGITFLVFLKMAFELSVRFYLPLAFLPFLLLGFWIIFFREKFNIRQNVILSVAGVLLVFSNLFFVQKYFSTLANYDKPGGGDVDVVILKEAEVFSQFIIQNSGGNQDVYIDGNGQFMFKGYKPIKYLVGKSNIDLHMASGKNNLPSQYFYIASASKMKKMQSAEDIKIISHATFGSFSVLLVHKI